MGGFFLTFYIQLLYYYCMKVQIHVIIDKEIKERLKQLAEKNGRSLNNLINKVLREFVERGKK